MYSSPNLTGDTISAFARLIIQLREFIQDQDFRLGNYVMKNDGSPVGDLDTAIENFIMQKLPVLLPGFQLIGEESIFPTEWNGNYVVVDPVDGTENYVSGIPIWGTGIALFVDNQLAASWVSFPEINMGIASKALDGFLVENFRAFRGPLKESRVSAYSSNSNWEMVAKVFPDEIRVFGCSLFNLSLAATSSITFNSSSKGVRLWDIVPAALVALESGKKVKINGEEYFGKFLNPNLRFVVEIQS
jgi:myo-inositol-1(or 4)-monophosphatase